MEDILKDMEDMFEDRKNGICPFCKREVDVKEFRNRISEREFQISGLCQECQDEFFG